MMHTIDVPEIQRFLSDRLAIEQELALDLSDKFNQGELNHTVRTAVWGSLLFLKGLSESDPAAWNMVREVEKANSWLGGLKKNLLPNSTDRYIDGVLAQLEKGTLPLDQYGDLIRFYGEIIDAASKPQYAATMQQAYWKAERAKQIGWRYGGGGEFWKAARNTDYRAEADRGSVWQKTETPKPPGVQAAAAAGARPKTTGFYPEGGRIRVKPGAFFSTGVNPFYDIVPGQTFRDPKHQNLNVKPGSGVTQWKLEDRSTIGRIDRAFGLPYGADISGTTTDTMHFLTGWTDLSSRRADPLVMMLPLATIVGQYHHSLIEVAAAMTLKKVIEYKIGFYTTLLPKFGDSTRQHPQRGQIRGVLERFDADPRNRHVLVYYKNNSPAIGGCFVAEPAEYPAFQKLATVDIGLWPRFNKMKSNFPSQDDIAGLLSDAGLQNAVAQSYRSGLRKDPKIYTPKALRGV